MKVWASEDNKKPSSRQRRFFQTTDKTRLGCLRQVAVFLQLPEPTWSVALDREGLVIDGGVLIGNLARQQHEHRLEHFMGDGDNGLLGPPTTDPALRATLELTGSSEGGPGDFTEDGADLAVAR